MPQIPMLLALMCEGCSASLPPPPALVSRNTHLKIALCSYPKAHHSRFSTRGGAGHHFSSCLCCYWLPSCISHPGNAKLFQDFILTLIFYSVLPTWNSVGTQTYWKTPVYLSKPNSSGWQGACLPPHFISLEHLALAASFVDREMNIRILNGQTAYSHHW